MNNEMLFESLDYGLYIIDGPFGSYTESIKVTSADFNRLYTQKVILPSGKSNIVYILSRSFNDGVRMLSASPFISPQSYQRIFYPSISFGKFMGKRYNMNVKKLAKEHNEAINKQTKYKPYNILRLPTKTIENFLFMTGDLYEAVVPILNSLSIKRNYMEFYSEFISILINMSPGMNERLTDVNSNNRLLLIDCSSFIFKPGAQLSENKTNPLFLLYLAYLRTHDFSKLNINMDMMICYKNLFMKFNPSKIESVNDWNKFKLGLFRIMNTNFDDYTKSLSEEDKTEIADDSKNHMVTSIIDKVAKPYTNIVSPETKSTLIHAIDKNYKDKIKNIKDMDKEIKLSQDEKRPIDAFTASLPEEYRPKSLSKIKPTKTPLSKDLEKTFSAIASNYDPLAVSTGRMIDADDDEEYDRSAIEDYEDEIENDVGEILTTEEEVAKEVLDDIQERTIPLSNEKTAPINSARDKKLREEQKKVVVKNETIEEILSRDTSNVPIEEDDKSAVLHTTNQNMYKVKFANYDKTYIEKMLDKDIVACFDQLKDKDSPFYITNIEVTDTSDALNLKETWAVTLRDENNKRHVMKVDIPKFQNNRFMLLNGTRWIILKQNMYNPLVKDTPDVVIMTTNFNKITIQRKATKSIGSIEKIFSFIKKSGDTKLFIGGDSSRGNMKYISSLEYDELSKRIFKYHSGDCDIYFSRDYINNNLEDIIPKEAGNNINPKNMNFIKGNEFFIGMEGNTPILINEDTGLDRNGRTICEIIENHLPEDSKSLYTSIKSPTQLMYAEGKLAGEFIPVIVTLIVWIGITKALDRMEIQWRFIPDVKRIPPATNTKKYIRFADGVLEYESKIFAELIMNGLAKLHPEKFQFEDFNSEVGYEEYIFSQWGSYRGINELKSFYSFLIDPITEQYCKDLFLPSDAAGLLIHAVKLLADNAYVSKASDVSYRTRSTEIIPAILYSCIASQYKTYVSKGRNVPMTLNQKCVIQRLQVEKTVEPYSTLNPVVEVTKTHTISTKGYRGSNSEFAYKDEEKRSYDPSSVGKISITSSPDANVGINKQLVIEPTLTNVRGYREQVDDNETLKDVNLFSPVEMLTPGTIRNDDPIRSAISNSAVVAVKLYNCGKGGYANKNNIPICLSMDA